jgi:hypothetical protein
MKTFRQLIAAAALLCVTTSYAWGGEIPNTYEPPPPPPSSMNTTSTEPSGGEIPNTETDTTVTVLISEAVTSVLIAIFG